MLVSQADRHTLRLRFERLLLILLILLGIAFRCINLDQKVFWVDEVATAIRIAGYTKAEVTERLANGSLHTPAKLLAYQHGLSDRSFSATLEALRKSPEHAPLYFLLLRGWTQLFGSSVVALRSFSVLCSLLLLPAVYWLSQQLWTDDRVGWMTVALVAISPFMIAYAQEARPYSLWLLTIALSSACLLNTLKRPVVVNWGLYAVTLTTGVYTSLLTLGVAVGHALYAWLSEGSWNRSVRRFSTALLGVIMSLLPWIWLISQQWSTLQTNTTWMRMPLPHFAKAVTWFYSAAVLYFDVPVMLHPAIVAAAEIAIATAVVAVILYAFYAAYKHTPASGKFLFILALPVPLLLILLDLVSDGRYSTAPRYLLPFHLAAQLAVAFLLSNRLGNRLFQTKKSHSYKWRGIATFLLVMCLLSNLINLTTSPRYLKNRNLHNQPIAEIINQSKHPLVLTESINTIDLLSLSHSLDSDIQLSILSPYDSINRIQALVQTSCQDILLFNPSSTLQQKLQQNTRLKQRYYPKLLLPGEFPLSLWQISPIQSTC